MGGHLGRAKAVVFSFIAQAQQSVICPSSGGVSEETGSVLFYDLCSWEMEWELFLLCGNLGVQSASP